MRPLYEARRQGRDQHQERNLTINTRLQSCGVEYEHMAQALREGPFLLYYQPLVCLADTEHPVVGVETRLRLRDEQGRILTAGDLRDRPDHLRFARDIGRFAFKRDLTKNRHLHSEGPRLRTSSNISTRYLLGNHLSADLHEALGPHPGVPREHLELELTESAPLQNFKHPRKILMYCGRLETRVGQDNFGTGHVSLSYLERPGLNNKN